MLAFSNVVKVYYHLKYEKKVQAIVETETGHAKVVDL